MDNITHSLIGITLAKLVYPDHRKKGRAAKLGRAAVWTGIISSNIPDLDIVVRAIAPKGEMGRFDYLLHHRGLSHTILAALPLGLFSAWIVARLFKVKPSAKLLFLGFLGTLLHVFADSWNDYGVHPFTPFMNRWFYGDAIFILEPLIWLSLIPLAMGEKFWKSIRGLWLIAALGLLGMLWFGPYAPMIIAAIATAWFAAQLAIYTRWKSAWASLGALMVVLAVFVWGSIEAKEKVKAQVAEQSSRYSRTISLLTSPAPADPWCWRVVHSSSVADDYVVDSGVVSLWPSRISPKTCHFRMGDPPLSLEAGSGFQPPLLQPTASIEWQTEYRSSLSELKILRHQYPAFDAFLGFARFPYWEETPGGLLQAGDLRYAGRSKRGFAQFEFHRESFADEKRPPMEGVMDGFR